MKWTSAGAAALALLVGACGYSDTDRVAGGAATGAVGGALVGGPVGAVVGAGVGGVAGAATEPSQLNLGQPPWSNPQVEVDFDRDDNRRRGSVASRRGGGGQVQAASANVREIQRELNQRGYDPGPVDGVWGPQTSRAAEAFQRANNMQATGRPDASLRQALNVDARGGTATGAGATGTGATGATGGGTGGTSPSSMNPGGGTTR